MVNYMSIATILLCIGSIFAGFANTGCQYMEIKGLLSSNNEDSEVIQLFIKLLALFLDVPEDEIPDRQVVGLWSFKAMSGSNKGQCYWFNETQDFSPSYRAAQVFGSICNACYWAILFILLAMICCKKCASPVMYMFIYFLFIITFFCCCFTFLIFNADICKEDGIECNLDVGGGLNIGAVLSLFLAIILIKKGAAAQQQQQADSSGAERGIETKDEEVGDEEEGGAATDEKADEKDDEKEEAEDTPEQPADEAK